MGLRHFAYLETREQYRDEDRGDHQYLFDEVNGEEDRHDPELQLHQFEEDQEREDESLLLLDPSPSSVGYASALHPSELILVQDHRHGPETSRGGRVVDRVNESSFRNEILSRVPDEVQGLHYAALERTGLGQFRDNRLLRQGRDPHDADRAVLEFLLPRDVVQPSNDPELAATYKILVGRAIGSASLDVRRVVARIIKSVRRGRRETKDGHQ